MLRAIYSMCLPKRVLLNTTESPLAKKPHLSATPPVKKFAKDDSCREVMEVRKLEVFEQLTGEHLDDARHHFLSKTYQADRSWQAERKRKFQDISHQSFSVEHLERLNRAIKRIPIMIGAKRIKEQLRCGGARALDHIEVKALVQREAQERNRLMEYVNLAAHDHRLEEFAPWVEFMSKQKIGHREPEKINMNQAKDIQRTIIEALAAINAAQSWPGTKVGLGNDLLKTRQPKRARLSHNKSFDLTVKGTNGDAKSHVEVTTAQNVRRPRDLSNAIQHGIDKAISLTKSSSWREVSIGVSWHEGRTDLYETHQYIQYHGDGNYSLFQANATGEDTLLYKRNIILDDLPHYIQRHHQSKRWLESINIFTLDGELGYKLTRNSGKWSIDTHDLPEAVRHIRSKRRLGRSYLAMDRSFYKMERQGRAGEV